MTHADGNYSQGGGIDEHFDDRRMADDIAKLASDAILTALVMDHQDHNQNWYGDYTIDGEVAALITRARELGVQIAPIYDGWDIDSYMPKAEPLTKE